MSSVNFSPVAWSDGMLIEVQHFQQLERHLRHQAQLRTGQTFSHGWGFSQLEVDEDAVGLGRLGLRKAVGVFPDGTPFALPQHDPLPQPLDTSAAQAGDLACLAVQSVMSDGPEMAFGTTEVSSRYLAVDADVVDAGVGLDPLGSARRLTMQVGKLRTRLCWRSQLRTDEVALAFAKVSGRTNNQVVSLSSQFIPPLLDCRVHPNLVSLISELRSVLQVRLAGMPGLKALSSGGGVADLIETMLRQAMAEYRMRLAQLDAFSPLPPAMLYHELVSLLGRLSVLPGVEDELISQDLAYRHDDLQSSFEPLSLHLRRALARVIETPIVPLRFEDRGDQVHLCMVDPQWKLQKMVFAVSASLPAEQLRKLLPQQAKLGPVEQIQKLVDLQLPGARLIPLAHPPRVVPYYSRSVYFEVESADPYWGQIFTGSAMAFRIVGDFPDLNFEAWGLREGKVS